MIDWPARVRSGGCAFGPARYQHHQATICQVVGEVAQEVHRCRIGPMHVLDDKQRRQLLQATLQQCACGECDLPLQLFRLEIVRTDFAHAQHVTQYGGYLLCHLGLGAKPLQTKQQLLVRDRKRVLGTDVIGLPKDGAKNAVGRLAKRRARGMADGDASRAALRPRACS